MNYNMKYGKVVKIKTMQNIELKHMK